jgi:ankyrin repeat protein
VTARLIAGLLAPLVATAALASAAPAGEVHNALEGGYVEKALALLNRDPGLINSRDLLRQTPLHVAARRGHADAVLWLLTHGADVNAVAYRGFTALHLTTSPVVALLLVRGGADLDQRDAWGGPCRLRPARSPVRLRTP